VNKADLPGADRVREQLRHALSLSPDGSAIPILSSTATTGAGVVELWQAIQQARRPAP